MHVCMHAELHTCTRTVRGGLIVGCYFRYDTGKVIELGLFCSLVYIVLHSKLKTIARCCTQENIDRRTHVIRHSQVV